MKLIQIIWFINKKLKEIVQKILFQNQIKFELFENLRDGEVHQEEVLKNQIKFESDLNEISKCNRANKCNAKY